MLNFLPTPHTVLAIAFVLLFFGIGHVSRSLWVLFRKRRATGNKSGVPIYQTRKWARMMFFNGLLSIEELNKFYAEFTTEE